jgi:drug/metabolite transporter (DMT)-like permease
LIAVLGGLGAAVCWAGALICATRATRLIGASSVLAWVMLVGFVVTAPPAAIDGVPEGLGARELGWLALAGAGNVGGLLLEYVALRAGMVSIVAPVISTEGAVAAVLAVLAGEAVGGVTGALLGLIVLGVVLASTAPGSGGSGDPQRTAAIAGAAALSFGVGLYATARVSEVLPLIWALIPARLVGVVAVAVPLAAVGRLRLTRAALPFVVASGLFEVLGFASYAAGSRHGIAVSAVLASQFAALAVLFAYLFFHERLTRLQLAGVAVIAVGVAVLSAVQA